MKFGNEIERESTPEWQAKYLNYKGAKKKLNAVGRAYRAAKSSPNSFLGGSKKTPDFTSPFQTGPVRSLLNKSRQQDKSPKPGAANVEDGKSPDGDEIATASAKHVASDGVRSQSIAEGRSGDSGTGLAGSGLTRYGSITGGAAERMRTHETAFSEASVGGPPSLHLPDPALHGVNTRASGVGFSGSDHAQLSTSYEADTDAFAIGKTRKPRTEFSPLKIRHPHLFGPRRTASTPGQPSPRPAFMKRIMSFGGSKMPQDSQQNDVEMAAAREYDLREAEFFRFLDKELSKINEFYVQKETEATERLRLLREQLDIMESERVRKSVAVAHRANGATKDEDVDPLDDKSSNPLVRPWRKGFHMASYVARGSLVGKGLKVNDDLAVPSKDKTVTDNNRDYVRKPYQTRVPYRTARRKLKLALQEYYRGLELLKAYALLNRKGFRKINKKHDKAVDARPTMRFMAEKVDKADFVQSDAVEKLIQTVEDLYATHFEKNHKIAASKLRAKTRDAGDYTGSVFRTGVWLSAAAVFGIQGLVFGADLLFSDDRKLAVETSYLLQLYAGYFLMNLLILSFCLACRYWSYSKINYAFVFEFDTRHHLNWRELCELPSFAMFLLGFFMWLNFSRYGANAMYIYYPVILIGFTLIVLFLPIPWLYHRMRLWFLFSNWRLLLGGVFYPVEFRDFFLGDMYCSETYAMGNIEVFFCLYANDWANPSQCNSSHSRLLGFFSALPGVWRALQCLRRYYDTRNIFPHLVNCGKYIMTICYYMTLSIFRISRSTETKGLFITFAAINAVYCSIWDLVMDWSLLDPYAKRPFLRENLGYKQIWLYYVALVVDPILRFNWIFYAIFADDAQHSAVLSFFVALSEVCRRGLWVLFRVENEHCTNVGRFRASRDIALPYDLGNSSSTGSSPKNPIGRSSTESRSTDTRDSGTPILPQRPHRVGATDVEAGTSTARTPDSSRLHMSPGQTFRRRPRRSSTAGTQSGPSRVTPTLRAVGSIMRTAHAEDYSRKKAPEQLDDGDESSDDDDDDAEGRSKVDEEVEHGHDSNLDDTDPGSERRHDPSASSKNADTSGKI